MVNPAPASFCTQANALLRKNLTFQKRNVKTNVQLILVPVALCAFLVLVQRLIDAQLDNSDFKCGCICANNTAKVAHCPDSEKLCGVQHSDPIQAATCATPNPPLWLPLLQLPSPSTRAVRSPSLPFSDLPHVSCRRTGSCPVTLLFTADNRSFAQTVSGNMFPSDLNINVSASDSDFMDTLAMNVLGTESTPGMNNYLEPAFSSGFPIYYVLTRCMENSGFSFPSPSQIPNMNLEVQCAQGLHLWRNSSFEINSELYKGYQRGNKEGQINEIAAAFDFLNSNGNRYNVSIWYNSTYMHDTGYAPIALLRIPRSVNLISNAYLQFLLGPGTKMLFEFVKEMPKPETRFSLEISSLLGSLFFTWVIMLLFPVSAGIHDDNIFGS